MKIQRSETLPPRAVKTHPRIRSHPWPRARRRRLPAGLAAAFLLFTAWAHGATLTVTSPNDSGAGSLRAALAAAASGDTIPFAPALHGRTLLLTSGPLLLSKNLTIQGPGYVRLFGPRIDIGAFEAQNHAPIARCGSPPRRVAGGGSCTASASAIQFDAGSSDPDGAPLTFAVIPPGPYPIGVTDVTFWAIDNHGASNSCLTSVTVEDGNDPTFHFPPAEDQVFVAPTGSNYALVTYTVTATAPCRSNVTASCSPPSGTYFPIGETCITCRAQGYDDVNRGFCVTVIPAPCLITVTRTNDSGAGSLRQAVADICPGGTIDFAPALNGQSIVLTNGNLVIGKNLTLLGPGPANLSVNGRHRSRVFFINPGVTSVIAGLTITNGCADLGGSGIFNHQGSLMLSNCSVSGNGLDCASGGGLYNSNGTVTVLSSRFDGNTAYSRGGGIYNKSGMLTLTSSTLSNNEGEGGSGTFDGAGLYNDGGTVTVNHCALNFNRTRNFNGSGGGIYNLGTLSVNNCTLSGNRTSSEYGVTGRGGGIYSGGTLTINNSTLSRNSADVSGGGIDYEGTLNLNNSTFSGNEARFAGALQGGGTLTISHTLLAKFPEGTNALIFGNITNLGFNLSDDSSCTFFGPTDIVTPDAKLGPLADNGGPTWTHALLFGSPAVNAGTNSAIAGMTYDQRGPDSLRLFGGRADIGAYELQTAVTVVQRVPAGLRLRGQGWPSAPLLVQWNSELRTNGWQTLTSGPTDASGNLEYTDTGAPGDGRRFYRAMRP
jgi:hypothetical protein